MSLKIAKMLSRTLFVTTHTDMCGHPKSEHVMNAREKYHELILSLRNKDEFFIKHYILATLNVLQDKHYNVKRLRLLLVVLMVLSSEKQLVDPLDLSWIVGLCKLPLHDLNKHQHRPLPELLLTVAHSLLRQLRPHELRKLDQEQQHRIMEYVVKPTLI